MRCEVAIAADWAREKMKGRGVMFVDLRQRTVNRFKTSPGASGSTSVS